VKRISLFASIMFFLFPHIAQSSTHAETGTAVAGVTTALDTYNGTIPGACPSNPGNSVISVSVSPAASHGTATATQSTYDCGNGSTGLVSLSYTPNADHSGTDTFSVVINWSSNSGIWTDTFNWTVTVSSASSSSSSPTVVSAEKSVDVQAMTTSVTKTTQTIAARVASVIKPKSSSRRKSNSPRSKKVTENNESQGLKNILASLSRPEQSGVGMTYDGTSVGIGAGDKLNGFNLKTNQDFGATGLSAGSTTDNGLGFWVKLSDINSEDKHFVAQSEGDMWMLIGGVDKRVTDDAAIGIAFTYENSNTDTNLSSTGIGTADSTAYTIAPYGVTLLTESVTMDVSAGFSWVDSDKRSNTNVTSNYDSTRTFLATNLNGYAAVGNFDLSSSIGWMSAWEDQEAYTDSTAATIAKQKTEFSMVSVIGEIAYPTETTEPYVNMRLEKDITWTDVAGIVHDQYGATLGGGVRFFMGNLIGEFNGEVDIGREQYEQFSFMGNLRYEY
jgi:hypothetical protein